MRKIFSLFLTLGIAFFFVTALAGDKDHLKARQLMEAGTILPLERILELGRLEHPGWILEVEFEQEDDRYIYEIELVDDKGEVWELEYDAKTGELIEKEQKE